jgi:hypothetical protein
VSSVLQFKSGTSPLDDLRELKKVEAEIDQVRCDLVRDARNNGATWEQVAQALGMTKQSAWEFFTERFRIELSHRVKKNTDLSEDAAMQLAVEETRVVRRRRTK